MLTTLIKGFPGHGVDAVLTAVVKAATSLGYTAVRESFPASTSRMPMEGVRIEVGRRTLTVSVREVEDGTAVAVSGGLFGGSRVVRLGQGILDRTSDILGAQAHHSGP